MTDLDLQGALIREIEELAATQSLKKADGEVWKDYHIYRQDKPYKDDTEDEDQEDYIIVMIDDEDTDAEGNWVVQIQILFSIMLYEEAHQGNLILANWMNQLDQWLCKKHIIDERYEMTGTRSKRFNHECYPNYYECAYISAWKLPPVHQEYAEDLI
jgi:hypothetical protein